MSEPTRDDLRVHVAEQGFGTVHRPLTDAEFDAIDPEGDS
jgi:hypothetical protein